MIKKGNVDTLDGQPYYRFCGGEVPFLPLGRDDQS